MFDFLKTEKNLERLAAAFYYGAILVVILVIVGAVLGFVSFFG